MSEITFDRDQSADRLGRIVGWFKSRERPILIAGATAQIMVLLGMIALRMIPFHGAQTVLLKVQPIDPRDMFRGDYVILSYDFNRVPPGGIPGLPIDSFRTQWEEVRDRTVYVSLVPEANGKHYRAGTYSITPPANGLFLRGKISRWNRIEFGIERHYVQEGTGHKYEEAIRNRRLWAEVRVAADGQGRVETLVIE